MSSENFFRSQDVIGVNLRVCFAKLTSFGGPLSICHDELQDSD